jgi:hypothetical protein
MELNCLERITVLELLGSYKEGDFITFKTLDSLRKKLGFTEEEIEKFELKIEENAYRWNTEGMKGIELDITEKDKELISKQLKEVNDSKKMNLNHYMIYEKFIKEDVEKDV